MPTDIVKRLGVALAIGLLVGFERGWHQREEHEGTRVAGLRTFGLIGFAGGLFALLAREFGWGLLAAAFLAIAAIESIAFALSAPRTRKFGITTEVASFATFALGALATAGYQEPAVAGAVVMTALLGFKPTLHRWVKSVARLELEGGLELLLISVVILPVLPDRGFGPWAALNPYILWWMVVLIAALSFFGYVLIRLAGPGVGIGLTGVLGGLASSTAVAVSFARRSAGKEESWRLNAAGVVLAASVMFPRLLVVVSAVNASLVRPLAPALLAAGAAGFAAGFWLLHGQSQRSYGPAHDVRNPLELAAAVRFGLLLALIMLASVALRQWLGETGLYLSAATAGLADVDAISLSLSRMARGGAEPAAAGGILVAAAVNTLSKAGLVAALDRGRMARAVAAVSALMLAAGGAAYVFFKP